MHRLFAVFTVGVMACTSSDDCVKDCVDLGDTPLDTPTDTVVDTDLDTDDTDDTDIVVPDCADFLSWNPADGATDAPRREPLVATFSAIEPSATLSLSLEGVDVPGRVMWDGPDFAFRATSPFQPGKTYDAELSWDCGSETMSFTTEGDALDPTALINRTYALDITSGTWITPAAGGGIVSGFLSTFTLVEVVGVTTTTLDLLIAAGNTGTNDQNLDIATTTQQAVDFTQSPTFSFNGTVNLPTPVPVALQGVQAMGRFTQGGSRVEDLRFTAQVDTRPISTLMGGPNVICDLALAFGFSCVSCPGGANFCVDLDIRDVVATEVNVSLVAVPTTSPTASCSTAPGAAGWLLLTVPWIVRRRRSASVG